MRDTAAAVTEIIGEECIHKHDDRLGLFTNDSNYHDASLNFAKRIGEIEPYDAKVAEYESSRSRTSPAFLACYGRIREKAHFNEISARTSRSRWADERRRTPIGPAALRASGATVQTEAILTTLDPSAESADLNQQNETDIESPHSGNSLIEPKEHLVATGTTIASHTACCSSCAGGPAAKRAQKRAEEIKRESLRQVANRHETHDANPKEGTLAELVANKRMIRTRDYYEDEVLQKKYKQFMRRRHAVTTSAAIESGVERTKESPNPPAAPSTSKEDRRRTRLLRKAMKKRERETHQRDWSSKKKDGWWRDAEIFFREQADAFVDCRNSLCSLIVRKNKPHEAFARQETTEEEEKEDTSNATDKTTNALAAAATTTMTANVGKKTTDRTMRCWSAFRGSFAKSRVAVVDQEEELKHRLETMSWDERQNALREIRKRKTLKARFLRASRGFGNKIKQLRDAPRKIRSRCRSIQAPKKIFRAALDLAESSQYAAESIVLLYVELYFLVTKWSRYFAIKWFQEARYNYDDLVSAVLEGGGLSSEISLMFQDKWAGLNVNTTQTVDGKSMLFLGMQKALELDRRLKVQLLKDSKNGPAPEDALDALKRRRSTLVHKDKLTRLLGREGGPVYEDDSVEDLYTRAEAQTSVIECLFKNGADVNTQQDPRKHPGSGWGLLHHAAANDNIDRLRWLTDRGAIVDLSTEAGETALMIAAKSRATRALYHLLEYRAVVSRSDTKGWTALHYAAASGAEHCAALLLRAGANKNVRTIGDIKCPSDLAKDNNHTSTYWLISLYVEPEIPAVELFEVIAKGRTSK